MEKQAGCNVMDIVNVGCANYRPECMSSGIKRILELWHMSVTPSDNYTGRLLVAASFSSIVSSKMALQSYALLRRLNSPEFNSLEVSIPPGLD